MIILYLRLKSKAMVDGIVELEKPLTHKDIDFLQDLYFIGIVSKRLSIYKIKAEEFKPGEVICNGQSYNIKALHTTTDTLLLAIQELLKQMEYQ